MMLELQKDNVILYVRQELMKQQMDVLIQFRVQILIAVYLVMFLVIQAVVTVMVPYFLIVNLVIVIILSTQESDVR